MFKSARWRSEKSNKIVAGFKFRFHATQVAEIGGNGLVLTVISPEKGKSTAKSEEYSIKENSCYWNNPVYETVKLIQDIKTGKIYDSIYNFVISTGSSKGSSIIGELCVNVADFVDATKPRSISYPFNNNKSHFHVSIQRIHENSNLRDLEVKGQRIEEEDRSLRKRMNNVDVEEDVEAGFVEGEVMPRTVPDLPELGDTHRNSSGSDITMSSSDGGSRVNTPRMIGVRNTNDVRDQNINVLTFQDQHRSRWDLAIVPANVSSVDSSTNSPIDVSSSDRSQMGVDDSVEKLKTDLVAISRRAELSELELQTLRKQIVKETKKVQDLSKEIACLKNERDALKVECDKLKNSQQRADRLKYNSKYQFEGDPWALLEETREDLTYEKELNANLRLQLQKTQESNSELLLAVQDLEEMLEKNNGAHLQNRSTSDESAIEIEESMLRCQSEDDEEQRALEELVRKHSDAQETYLLEQKIMDLSSELEMYRRDKDELEIQMEQLALDYEILKQENHEFSTRLEQSHLREQLKTRYESLGSHTEVIELEAKNERLRNELEEQSRELSHCLETIKELEAHNEILEDELEKQVGRYNAALSESTTTINELQHEIKKLTKDHKQKEEEVSGCLATITELDGRIKELENELIIQSDGSSRTLTELKELEVHIQNLEEELEKQAEGYEADLEAVTRAKVEQEQRAIRADGRIKELENELIIQSDASSRTLTELKELEVYIQNLEEELEKQAEGFEADLEGVTRAKVEQEQKAIRAEEALRLMKWKNANTAARLQDEFKKLSLQMQSSFEANEVVANKAMDEARELRLMNHQLRDMLQKANEDHQSDRYDYEVKIQELRGQIEQLQAEFENQNKNPDVSASLSEVKAEVERLTSENKLLLIEAKQVEELRFELEHMKALNKERNLLVEAVNMERDELQAEIALMKDEVKKSDEEINELRHLKDDEEQVVTNLHSEVETLRLQCDNLKHSLYEDELEKEKLRKKVFQLMTDIKKKDEAISIIEKRLKENSGRVVVQDRSKVSPKNTKSEQLQRGSKEVCSKEVTTLREKIKLLEGQIRSKETDLETSSNVFLVKERELQGKIDELEIRLGLLEQTSPVSNQHKAEESVSVGMQTDSSEASISPENLNIDSINSNVQTLANTGAQARVNNSEQQKYDVLSNEMEMLKERNNSMEIELREMQERYSDISLKFAEVEGERQQLVMRLRNLKNARKS